MDTFPEWLKVSFGFLSGTAAWGICFYFAKNWFESRIIKPIEEIKEENKKLRSVVFNIVESNNSLVAGIGKEISQMAKMYAENVREALEAKNRSQIAIVSAEKLGKIVSLIHDENKTIKTEISKLNEEFIFIKTKK